MIVAEVESVTSTPAAAPAEDAAAPAVIEHDEINGTFGYGYRIFEFPAQRRTNQFVEYPLVATGYPYVAKAESVTYVRPVGHACRPPFALKLPPMDQPIRIENEGRVWIVVRLRESRPDRYAMAKRMLWQDWATEGTGKWPVHSGRLPAVPKTPEKTPEAKTPEPAPAAETPTAPEISATPAAA